MERIGVGERGAGAGDGGLGMSLHTGEVGDVVRMAPPSFTTQKLRRWKRFRPEILPLALPDISSKAMEGMYFYF